MLHKTSGIALKVTNYGDSGIVAHVYTEVFGMQAYLVNGARKPRARIPANLFQPLQPLDLVVYYKETNGLQRIKEVRPMPVLREIPLDMAKGAIALFLDEILYKVLRQQSPDAFLFHFVKQAIAWLDTAEGGLANFHLIFLIKLSRFLGFLPLQHNDRALPFFDLLDGVFCSILPAHTHVLQEPHTSLFLQLLQTDFAAATGVRMNRENRKYLLEKVLEFYKLHTENFGQVNSLYILEDIFN